MRLHTRRVSQLPPLWSADTVFASDDHVLVGFGIADRIEIPAPWRTNLVSVHEQLADIGVDNELPHVLGTGAIGFASLPFDRDESAIVVIPEVVWGQQRTGSAWVTTRAGSDEPLHRARVGTVPNAVSMTSRTTREEWAEMIDQALRAIAGGEVSKIVLSRCLDIEWDCAPSLDILAQSMWNASQGGYRYLVDGHLGLSPELLLAQQHDVVFCQPMAGTTARTGNPSEDRRRALDLLGSDKNLREHAITVDAVHDELLNWCSYVDAEPSPSIVEAGSVQHLATTVTGHLMRPSSPIGEIVSALHPTPAIAGSPRDRALGYIAQIESVPRGRYAGPVGWLDGAGNGCFAVALRGMQIQGATATAHGGVGVVRGSVAAEEFAETTAKLSGTVRAAGAV